MPDMSGIRTGLKAAAYVIAALCSAAERKPGD